MTVKVFHSVSAAFQLCEYPTDPQELSEILGCTGTFYWKLELNVFHRTYDCRNRNSNIPSCHRWAKGASAYTPLILQHRRKLHPITASFCEYLQVKSHAGYYEIQFVLSDRNVQLLS